MKRKIIKQLFYGNQEKIRKQQIELISSLCQWYKVREDLLFAFEKTSETGIAEPMKSIIDNFITRTKSGFDIESAINLMLSESNDEDFTYTLRLLNFNMKFRGNVSELLENLETQIIRVDSEYTRRKIESTTDRRYLILLSIFVPLIFVWILFDNDEINQVLLSSAIGIIAIIISCMMYFAGLFIAYKSKENI